MNRFAVHVSSMALPSNCCDVLLLPPPTRPVIVGYRARRLKNTHSNVPRPWTNRQGLLLVYSANSGRRVHDVLLVQAYVQKQKIAKFARLWFQAETSRNSLFYGLSTYAIAAAPILVCFFFVVLLRVVPCYRFGSLEGEVWKEKFGRRSKNGWIPHVLPPPPSFRYFLQNGHTLSIYQAHPFTPHGPYGQLQTAAHTASQVILPLCEAGGL